MSESNGAAIQKAEPKELVPIVNGVLVPTSMEGLWRIAQMYVRSGLLPHGVTTADQAFIVLECGLSLGLSPAQAIQGIMVVNNRPTIWGDAALAVCQSSGKLADIKEYFEGDGDNLRAVCEIIRSDRLSPIIRTFSVADAKRAKLWGKSGPWTNYTSRMLQMRARSFAMRDAFPDALRGIGIREEVDDYQDLRGNATPTPSAKVAERRAMLTADPVIEVEPAAEPSGPITITTEEIDTIFKGGK